jgi:transposase InsO family protein
VSAAQMWWCPGRTRSGRSWPKVPPTKSVERPAEGADITYTPLARGFVCLVVVLDWFSRRASSWRVSITMEADFCVDAVEEALARYGKPEIFNTDQGSQFTGVAFTGLLLRNEIAISMDGKGAWRDNVFVERLWRTVKHEEAYLKAYDSVSEARTSIGRYLDFYNSSRPHSQHGGRTPDQAWFAGLPPGTRWRHEKATRWWGARPAHGSARAPHQRAFMERRATAGRSTYRNRNNVPRDRTTSPTRVQAQGSLW